MQEKVRKWIDAGCNFNSGVEILAGTGRHKQLAKVMSGHEKRYADKLKYELLKAAGLPTGLPTHGKTFQTDVYTPALGPVPVKAKPVMAKPLPPEVEKAIKLHADAFKTRSILHATMANLPTDNIPALVSKRLTLSNEIAECSAVIDIMWKAKEDFYVNNIVPDVKALLATLQVEETRHVELPDTPVALRDMKKHLQSANSKDQFQLDYRQTTKGEHKNPLPQSPKRLKIELRMKQRSETIEAIDFKLLSLS